ncbi:MAG: cytochrome C oxidase subunit IV family protein [Armatimonadota bacterium]
MATHGHGHGHGHSAGHGAHEEYHPPHIPMMTYHVVFGALMVLLFLTVGAAMVDLGPANFPLAMAIAIAKAALVMAFFMHLKVSSRLVVMFSLGAFVWLLILFFMTMNDYWTRSSIMNL